MLHLVYAFSVCPYIGKLALDHMVIPFPFFLLLCLLKVFQTGPLYPYCGRGLEGYILLNIFHGKPFYDCLPVV